MNIEEKLLREFPNLVSKVYWEKRDNFDFLVVEIKKYSMEEVSLKSKQISAFLDENDNLINKQYFLEVISCGKSLEITIDELEQYENKYVELIIGEEPHVGKFYKRDDEYLVIKENNKGQFLNKKYEIKSIEKINKYIKI